MVERSELERIAHTESVFREVNERIAESAERFDADDAEFVCECADAGCTQRIGATLDEYEEARELGTTFLLVPGHEDERVEGVVEVADGRAVVEKREPTVASIVQKLDPRAA
jgi:hypothetical protein